MQLELASSHTTVIAPVDGPERMRPRYPSTSKDLREVWRERLFYMSQSLHSACDIRHVSI
jgi:hypothetical protein